MINTILVEKNGRTYLDCLPGEGQVCGEKDALELVGACGEHQTSRLLLREGTLCPDFFRLRTRVAGDVLLKFSTYRLRAAAVLSPETVKQGKFEDMVIETNRGSQFRVFSSVEQAEDWLVSG